jgi:hypothetical protein
MTMRRRGAAILALGGMALGSGCISDDGSSCPGLGGDRVRAALIDATAWTAEAAEDDPIAEHRPATLTCLPTGAYAENSVFEVDTDDCNYAAFVQPSLETVAPGDRVAISLAHDDLVAPEPADAHVALLLGEQVLWDRLIAIPNVPTPYNVEVEVPDCAPSGTPVHLHLHNHGVNSWRLLSVDLIPTE